MVFSTNWMSHWDPHSLLDKLYLLHPWFYGYESILDIKSFNFNALFRAKDNGDTSKPKAWVTLGRSYLGFLNPHLYPLSAWSSAFQTLKPGIF